MSTVLLTGGHGMARQCMCRGCGRWLKSQLLLPSSLKRCTSLTGNTVHVVPQAPPTSVRTLKTLTLQSLVSPDVRHFGVRSLPLFVWRGQSDTQSQFVQGFKASIAIVFFMARADLCAETHSCVVYTRPQDVTVSAMFSCSLFCTPLL